MAILDKLKRRQEGGVQPAPDCSPTVVYAPADGTVIPLEEFPDELFSASVLGPGCGILPSGNTVAAPFNGIVTQLIDTLHAVGVTSDSGVEVLIHIGVDTVDMNGKGFQADIKNGQKIRLGDPLILFDRDVIHAAGHADAIAIVVTNSDEHVPELIKSGDVKAGEPILQIRK